MKNQVDILSKENSLVLRGLAIIPIVLHNFLHNPALGFSHENEMSFVPEYAKAFFPALISSPHPVAEFFSFLGWVGVAVFAFLTGFGLALKTPPATRKSSWQFIKRGWMKLFILMLPVVCLYAIGDVMQHNFWPDLFKRASYLTLLVNFAYPYLKVSPGVYWYFGLTFQFYLLWAVCGKSIKDRGLLIWSIILMAFTLILCFGDCPDALSIFKHCFTGWFPVFAIGIYLARNKGRLPLIKLPIWLELLLIIVLIVLTTVMNLWLVTWLFVPITGLIVFLLIGHIILRTGFLENAFRWIGGISAYIFVCHPIARVIVNKVILHRVDSIFVVVLFYLAISVAFALIYRPICCFITSVVNHK